MMRHTTISGTSSQDDDENNNNHDDNDDLLIDEPPPPFVYKEDDSVESINQAVITHVIIDSTVKEIEKSAFKDCGNLKKVEFRLPTAGLLTKIGNRSFQNCSRLVELEFPAGLDTIAGYAFLGCHALETIRAPSTLRRVGEAAFARCSSLRSFSKLDGLQFIGFNAFVDCESLVDIELSSSEGLNYIGARTFINCQSLQRITIPSTVELIWGWTFQNCTSLQDVQLYEGVRTIFRCAFTMCIALKSIDIPSTVETIEEEAFSSCKSMRTVTLREGLVTIGQKAFAHCESLSSISIPSTVYSLGHATFQRCLNLTDVELQEGLVGIGISTFADCQSLCGISFPQSLKVLRGTAFSNCSNLLGVEIPMDSDLTIYRDESAFRKRPCFSGCNELVSLSIPSSMFEENQVTSEYAFSQCPKLQHVDTNEFQSQKVRDRFDSLPVHACCYQASRASLDDLMQAIDNDSYSTGMNNEIVDGWGMSPFHIVATSAKLRADMLQLLLDRYPTPVIFQKDDFGKTMMDYLMMQGSSKAIPLVQMTLQSSLAYVMNGCSLDSWRDDLLQYVTMETLMSMPWWGVGGSIPTSRWACYGLIMKRFAHYIKMESTSILELVLWKMKIRELQQHLSDGENVDHRANCRWNCGSDVVMQNVIEYAWDDQCAAFVASRMLPLCSSTGADNTRLHM